MHLDGLFLLQLDRQPPLQLDLVLGVVGWDAGPWGGGVRRRQPPVSYQLHRQRVHGVRLAQQKRGSAVSRRQPQHVAAAGKAALVGRCTLHKALR